MDMKRNSKAGELVRLMDLDPEFIIDLRYAGSDNFTGHKIYESNECWLNKHTAEMLIKAKNMFKDDGLKVKIWDAYRPVSAQRSFWKIMPDDRFVARPPTDKQAGPYKPTHLNGLCIDLTLTDAGGTELAMPTPFDSFEEKASLEKNNPESIEYKNAAYLRDVMEAAGFSPYKYEWWHFYDRKTEPGPALDFNI
jgi:D-alanyl-D-alanine dipeptidase